MSHGHDASAGQPSEATKTTAQLALTLALAHSDRYLRELVEQWDICPFARRCRQEGRLWRRVVWAEDAEDAGPRLDAAMDALEATAAPGEPEVALLLCPGLQDLDPQAFNAVYVAARARYQARHLDPAFYMVAFHPELRLNASSPGSLINFWRRSPHPTLQLVSVALLARLRQVDRARDPSRIALELAATGAAPEEIADALDALRDHQPVSERVAQRNGETFNTEGAAVFVQTQTSIATQVAEDRATAGPWRAEWPDSDWIPTATSPDER